MRSLHPLSVSDDLVIELIVVVAVIIGFVVGPPSKTGAHCS
jgi:hypothetical protein